MKTHKRRENHIKGIQYIACEIVQSDLVSKVWNKVKFDDFFLLFWTIFSVWLSKNLCIVQKHLISFDFVQNKMFAQYITQAHIQKLKNVDGKQQLNA